MSTEPASPLPVVEVDRDICVGSGYCQRVAPGVFDVDDSGLAYVLIAHPTGPDADAAREAERSCPSMAISFEAPSAG
jgi:ferredoxin